MSVLERLKARGLVHQTTAEDLGAILAAGPITFYNGYDPTAASLHVGHLLPLTLMKHLQRAGHRVIALIGGGTGLIGDPSGKSTERNLLTAETVMENGLKIHAQVTRLLQAEDNPPLYVNNLDWLGEVRLLDFLRDIGKHFAVNAMIQRDSVKSRFERDGEGISFTEFSYSLLQAYDFLELHKRYGCSLQTGGSDQWGNIVNGTDLIRRMTGTRAFGLTVPLLTDADGKKFGKSEKGAVFLDPSLTSPYAFYQFWLNTSDADAPRFLRLFTDSALDAIEALDTGSGARPAQRLLAETLTRDIHGEEALEGVKKASEALFSGEIQGLPVGTLLEIFADVPSIGLPQAQLANGVALVDLLVATGLTASKGDAKRQIQQGAIRLNGGEAITGDPVLTANAFIDGTVLVLRRGKKNYGLVKIL